MIAPRERGSEECGERDQGPALFETLRHQGIEVLATPRKSSLSQDVRHTLVFLNHWRTTVVLPQCKPAHDVAAAQAGRRGLPWVLSLQFGWPPTTGRPWGPSGAPARGVDRPAQVIPYGVQVPATATGFRADPFRVVFSGRVWEHQKRASLVIRTLIRASRSKASFRATLIGDG